MALLRRHDPDVVCLQEVKSERADFPVDELNAAGYRSVLHGQSNFNGVAILVKDLSRAGGLAAFDESAPKDPSNGRGPSLGPPTEVQRGFPGDPVPEEARLLSVCVGGLRIVNAYVINGEAEDSDKFPLKERWMGALAQWLKQLPTSPPVLLVGDFNVAPDQRDVWDPTRLQSRIHCTEAERAWLRQVQGDRLSDLLRVKTKESGIHTWWPYQEGALERGEGLRFDLAFGDGSLVARLADVWVDKHERLPESGKVPPSDHAPVVVDLEWPPLTGRK